MNYFKFLLVVTCVCYGFSDFACIIEGTKLIISLISEKYDILYKSMYQVNGELGSCDITDFSTVANLRGRIKELMKTLKNHIS